MTGPGSSWRRVAGVVLAARSRGDVTGDVLEARPTGLARTRDLQDWKVPWDNAKTRQFSRSSHGTLSPQHLTYQRRVPWDAPRLRSCGTLAGHVPLGRSPIESTGTRRGDVTRVALEARPTGLTYQRERPRKESPVGQRENATVLAFVPWDLLAPTPHLPAQSPMGRSPATFSWHARRLRSSAGRAPRGLREGRV